MRLKILKKEHQPLRVVDADTGEVVEGIHDITYEATCLSALLTIHLIDFDVEVVEEATINRERLPKRCELNIPNKTIEGGAIANRQQL